MKMDEKTIKITFVDPQSNNEVEIITSNENAQRAEADADFANALFSSLRQGDSSDNNGSHGANLNDSSLEYEAVVGGSPQPHQTSAEDNDGSSCRWSSACVLLLLNTYRKYEYQVTTGKLSNTKLCKKLADELQAHGFCVTGLQCGSKLRSLKRTYKSVKNHNEKFPFDRRLWEFFDIMEEMFGKKALCKPMTIFSSNSFCSTINNKNLRKRKGIMANEYDEALGSSSIKKTKQNDCSLDSEFILGDSPVIDNDSDNDASLYRWTAPCVWLLLERYEKYTSTVVQISNKKLCKKLSDDLKSHGFIVSEVQVGSKLRSLKKTYKSIKENNARKPYERRHWEFFDKIEELFGKRAWSNKGTAVSSAKFASGQNSTNFEQTAANPSTATETGEALEDKCDATVASLLKQRLQQKEAHEAEKARRHADKRKIAETTLSTKVKSREALATLLKQRIQQKEEHEARKAKRHQEKMEIAAKRLKMDEELLTLLKRISSSKNV